MGSHLHECPPHIQVIHTCRASGWSPQGCDSYPGKHRKKRSINYYRYHLVTTAVTLAVAPAWLLFTAGTQAFWLHTMRMPLASLTFAPSLQISSATCNEIHLRYQFKCKKIKRTFILMILKFGNHHIFCSICTYLRFTKFYDMIYLCPFFFF